MNTTKKPVPLAQTIIESEVYRDWLKRLGTTEATRLAAHIDEIRAAARISGEIHPAELRLAVGEAKALLQRTNPNL